MHHKSTLPTKLCPVCQRPFTWRKKWERDWEQVVYCSQRCRQSPRPGGSETAPASANRLGKHP